MAISDVLLDVGGVLILQKRDEVYKQACIETGIPVSRLQSLVRDFSKEEMQGKNVDPREFIDRREKRISGQKLLELRKALWDTEEVNQELIQFLLTHKNRVRFSILTNNYKAVDWVLHEKHSMERFYDRLINSADIGVTKPDPKFFLYSIQKLEIQPDQALLVDDSVENVRVARESGMKAIRYSDFKSFRNELLDYLG